MDMIEVRDLSKRYRDRVVVDELSFTVPRGEILGLLGPNGAGKSTTLKMLTGFLLPTTGAIRVDGRDLGAEPLEVKRRMGYLPEAPPLYPELSVKGYLRFVGVLRGVPKRELSRELERVAVLTGLTSVLDRLIGNLSKGFRQRVGIAQALLNSPPVLILDEPTDGLDPGQRAEVRALIKGLAGQHTVILSTHLLGEVTATCQRVLILHHGRSVAHDLLENLPHLPGQLPGASLEATFLRLTAS